MMELKVWVEGIQRVVCGATFDTTCQDVVIALAHAMGRTGRFTLIEKWRDNDRPLTPAECPLKVLHKWGEYAGEVRFILCQADADRQRQSSQDRVVKRGADRPLFSHNFTPPHTQGVAAEASVKRSLTFSGAHNNLSEASSWLSSSAPTSKFRKTQLGPVPNGDIKQPQKSRYTSHPSAPSLPRHLGEGGGGVQQPKTPSSVHPQHPVPPPRHRPSPAPPQQGRDNLRNSALPSVPASSSSSSTLVPQGQGTNVNQQLPSQPSHASRHHPVPQSHLQLHPQPQPHHPSPPQPQSHSQSHPQPHSRSQPKPQPQLRSQPQGPVQRQNQRTQPVPNSRDSTPSPQPPPLPTSPPPTQPNAPSQHSSNSSQEQPKTMAAIEMSLDATDHSRQASLEIEEYDLDRNFPDNHRDPNRSDRPSISLEYRLEDGVGPGSGGQLEGEHAKLMRLVNMQQERLKTQESQISLVNTEITALEEKEKEYEEGLQVIMEELLLHENRQRDLDPQLTELEQVEWENVLDGEKKCEVDLTLQLASCKAKILEHEHKLDDVREEENQLLSELKLEEEKISQEKERLKAEEAKAREEESKTKEELSKLQEEFSVLQKTATDCEASLSTMDSELKSVEKDLEGKRDELEDLEVSLKDENLKNFAAHPVPTESTKSPNSGETIIKILEGRLSPHPTASVSSKAPDTPSTPPFIAALASKNQSGVWV